MSAGRQYPPPPPPKPAWMAHAPCNDADIDLFYPEKGEAGREARALCNGGGPAARPICPFRTQCLDYALTSREPYGLWGGFSEPERRRMLRSGERLPFPPPVPAEGSGHPGRRRRNARNAARRAVQPTVREQAAGVPHPTVLSVRERWARGVDRPTVAAWHHLPVPVVEYLTRGVPQGLTGEPEAA